MTKRIAAILMCAVMVLVAAAPLALATHDVIKGAKGPRASAVTWEYVPVGYGIWTGHIVNNGLRSLTVDVADNTTGVPVDIMHQKIRFAVYDAYPIGTVDTEGVIMAAGHLYEITVMPNGPTGSTCTVDDVFTLPAKPVAAITLVSQNYLDVAVSGSGSSDADGTIVAYDWAFGDGSSATGMIATHSYAAAGTYTITLTVTDNDGLTGSADMRVTVGAPLDSPPVASFTVAVNGLTVDVNAAGSSDDKGIVSYVWNWGDGTTGTGMITSHTYGIPPIVAASALSARAPPGTPHPVFGYTYAADGVTILSGCTVTITDMRTWEMITTTSSIDGIYSVDLSELQLGWAFGDILNVNATKGTTMFGWAQAPVTDTPLGYDQIDVILLPTGGSAIVTITLTVTDTIGQTASVSQRVTITW